MTRIALIIKGHSNSATEEQLDLECVQSYYLYLHSIAGGAWEDNEIIYIKEPDFDELNNFINTVNPTYALTILIGHGATQTNHQLFQINKTTIIKPGQFVFNAPKQLILVESCRNDDDQINWVDLENKVPQYKFGGWVRRHIDWDTSKHIFMADLKACNPGIVICHSCSPNESAHDYYFSNKLLKYGQKLFLDTRYFYQTFGIISIMPHVAKRVNRKANNKYGVNQIPEVIGDINFPFAVSMFDLLPPEKELLQKLYEEGVLRQIPEEKLRTMLTEENIRYFFKTD